MKELILEALAMCMEKLPKINEYKETSKEIPIKSGNILEITEEVTKIAQEYKKELTDIYITSDEDETSIFNTDGLVAYIPMKVLKTKDEINAERIKRFNSRAYRYVYDLLTVNGFKRVPFSSGLLKEFEDTNLYQMYTNKEFDRLEKYYSLFFKKIEEETICCDRCGHEYDRHIGDLCPNCNHDNQEQYEEKYG